MSSVITDLTAKVVQNFVENRLNKSHKQLSFEKDKDLSSIKEITQVKNRAKILSNDILRTFVYNQNVKDPDEVSRTLQWLVWQLQEETNGNIPLILEQLEIKEGNEKDLIYRVLDSVFSDKNVNWGRIAITYAFGVKLAKMYEERLITGKDELILNTVGEYVGENLSPWIYQQGGWENVAMHYHNETEEEMLRKFKSAGALAFAIGLGALMTTFSPY